MLSEQIKMCDNLCESQVRGKGRGVFEHLYQLCIITFNHDNHFIYDNHDNHPSTEKTSNDEIISTITIINND